MNKRRILIVTGTRAEYGLLKSSIQGIRDSDALCLILLATGMHTKEKNGYTLDVVQSDFPVDHVVPVDEDGIQIMGFAQMVQGMYPIMEEERPDILLILGDRYEPLAAAEVALSLNIPIAHIHGGDSSGPQTADEFIRHQISMMAHVHFPVSRASAKRLELLGQDPQHIHMFGSPSLDLIDQSTFKTKSELAGELGFDADKRWVMVVQHPTPLDEILVAEQINPTLEALRGVEGEKIFIYPNSDDGGDQVISAIEKYTGHNQCHVFPNLDHELYMNLMALSAVLVGNSSSGVLEAGHFKIPVVDIGARQFGRERGENVIHVDYDRYQIVNAINKAFTPEFIATCEAAEHPYGSGNAGKQIVKVLEEVSLERLTQKRLTYDISV